MTLPVATLTEERALADLRDLWRIRLLEERVRDLRLAGDIQGSVHLCIGQEAGPVGVCAVLHPQGVQRHAASEHVEHRLLMLGCAVAASSALTFQCHQEMPGKIHAMRAPTRRTGAVEP